MSGLRGFPPALFSFFEGLAQGRLEGLPGEQQADLAGARP